MLKMKRGCFLVNLRDGGVIMMSYLDEKSSICPSLIADTIEEYFSWEGWFQVNKSNLNEFPPPLEAIGNSKKITLAMVLREDGCPQSHFYKRDYCLPVIRQEWRKYLTVLFYEINRGKGINPSIIYQT